jgi:hypothetical protein
MCVQRPDVCHQERCISPISAGKSATVIRDRVIRDQGTHREDANTLQSPDVLVQILHVRVDLMPCGNRRLEDILCRIVLEVSAM